MPTFNCFITLKIMLRYRFMYLHKYIYIFRRGGGSRFFRKFGNDEQEYECYKATNNAYRYIGRGDKMRVF